MPIIYTLLAINYILKKTTGNFMKKFFNETKLEKKYIFENARKMVLEQLIPRN